MGYFQVPQMFFSSPADFTDLHRFTQISGIKRYLSIKEKVQFQTNGIEPLFYETDTEKSL